MSRDAALPLLPTTVVGAHGRPSWLHTAKAEIARGAYGPIDAQEALDDAVEIAILDQTRAGIDIITDGEMRREGFLATFAGRITNLRNVGPLRKVGEVGLDMEPVLETTGRVEVPLGMGIVEEFAYLQAHTTKPIKVTCPGPYALTAYIRPVEGYRSRRELAEAFVPAINAELRRLVAAGATFIQVDEPAISGVDVAPTPPADMVALFNQAVEGVQAKLALHICFGTYRKMPYAPRTYRPYLPVLRDARADHLVLEFANRLMAEIELWRELGGDRELGAGVIDVRNWYVETPEEVAALIRTALQHVPAEKLYLNPDCGLRRQARWVGYKKLQALAAGAAIVRRELTGG
ncbi:MAG TPA: methionine synthase [Chloroflexota bacterium]|nr:methionine synthase [Chloroflexota bacterium]